MQIYVYVPLKKLARKGLIVVLGAPRYHISPRYIENLYIYIWLELDIFTEKNLEDKGW